MFEGPDLAALRLADAMSAAPGSLTEEVVAELRSRFGEIELAELILVCGQANLNNRAANAAKRLLDDGQAREPDR